MKSTKVSLFLIFLTVFIDLLGFGILIPLLPNFAKISLHVDETAVGIAVAVYSLTQFLFNPIFGRLSDKYGRRSIIIYCLLLNALGYVIFAYTKNYYVLLLSRFVSGLGGSSIGVAQAYIADVTTPQNRSKGMSVIGAAFALGFVFGPLTGGVLAHIGGYSLTGFVSAGFSFSAFIVTLIMLPESLPKGKRNLDMLGEKRLFDFGAFKKLFLDKSLGLSVIMFFILTFSNANMFGTFALLGKQHYNFTDLQNGMAYAIIGLTSAFVQGALTFASKYVSDRKVITLGSFCMVVGFALLPVGTNFTQLGIFVAILTLGTGSLQPVILGMVSKNSNQKEQGVILGLNQSFSAIARVLGPLWGGFTFQHLGYQLPFWTGSFFSLTILLFAVFYFKEHITPAPHPN
ncbi:MAG: MFS transporter [Bacteroidota bacterium]|nr:MFS transporter [Bacteroidota bacterium]